jgi:hypothetical protein
MSWVDVIGYAASVTVLATFCMTTMFHLRLLAIGSNILFICFGALAHIYPVLLLHIILLPVNDQTAGECVSRAGPYEFTIARNQHWTVLPNKDLGRSGCAIW